MVKSNQVVPEKVTKPIQLLAAWLVGLILVNGSFLSSAVALGAEYWVSSLLIVAAVTNVPIFLGAIFMLQTKFRPELQEDSYYASYLDKKTNKLVTVRQDEASEIVSLKEEFRKLELLVECKSSHNDVHSFGMWRISLNDYLSEFNEIRGILNDNNIHVSSIFGKRNTKEIPNPKILAINEGMDSESVLILLKLLSGFELDGYIYFEPISEINEDDVYIGSYGYENSNYYPFNDELKNILPTAEVSDLRYFETGQKH